MQQELEKVVDTVKVYYDLLVDRISDLYLEVLEISSIAAVKNIPSAYDIELTKYLPRLSTKKKSAKFADTTFHSTK